MEGKVRKKGSGGYREGAGRKPNPPTILQIAATYDDPQNFLRAVMNDSETDAKLRVDAAKALMPFVHTRKGSGGKKGEAEEKAKKAANRFAPASPPKLVVAGGQKV